MAGQPPATTAHSPGQLSQAERRVLHGTLIIWAVFTIELPRNIHLSIEGDYRRLISDHDVPPNDIGNCDASTQAVQAACAADQATAPMVVLMLIAAALLVGVVVFLTPRAAHSVSEQVQRIVHLRNIIGLQAALVLAVMTILLTQVGPGTVDALTLVTAWGIPLVAWFVLLAIQSAAETTTGPRWPLSRFRAWFRSTRQSSQRHHGT